MRADKVEWVGCKRAGGFVVLWRGREREGKRDEWEWNSIMREEETKKT